MLLFTSLEKTKVTMRRSHAATSRCVFGARRNCPNLRKGGQLVRTLWKDAKTLTTKTVHQPPRRAQNPHDFVSSFHPARSQWLLVCYHSRLPSTRKPIVRFFNSGSTTMSLVLSFDNRNSVVELEAWLTAMTKINWHWFRNAGNCIKVSCHNNVFIIYYSQWWQVLKYQST